MTDHATTNPTAQAPYIAMVAMRSGRQTVTSEHGSWADADQAAELCASVVGWGNVAIFDTFGSYCGPHARWAFAAAGIQATKGTMMERCERCSRPATHLAGILNDRPHHLLCAKHTNEWHAEVQDKFGWWFRSVAS